MARDAARSSILHSLIIQAGVPLVSVSVSDLNAEPPVIVLQFEAGATAEQIALANQIKDAFDWRRRRALTRNTVVAAFQALDATQRNQVMTHIFAEYLRTNVNAANQMAAFLGVPLVVDEIDPT